MTDGTLPTSLFVDDVSLQTRALRSVRLEALKPRPCGRRTRCKTGMWNQNGGGEEFSPAAGLVDIQFC
jgi:hypothetical protein